MRSSSLAFRRFLSSSPIRIPEDKIQFTFVRSSGPGGQNVNKVNSCAEARFVVKEATWMDEEVRERLVVQQAGRINKLGELVISSQKERSQFRNRMDCVEKLREMIEEASVTPKERVMTIEVGERAREKRKLEKEQRAQVKGLRNKITKGDRFGSGSLR